VSVETAVLRFLEKKAPLSHVTVSSDSNGSLPVFDKLGNLVRLTIAGQKTLLGKFRSVIRRKILDVEQAAELFSANPARFYKLGGKGAIAPGKDADLILLDREHRLTDVIAKGRLMMADGRLLARSTFSAS
jgi:beta-aspartyl-dipeptidase (metallo-type)